MSDFNAKLTIDDVKHDGEGIAITRVAGEIPGILFFGRRYN